MKLLSRGKSNISCFYLKMAPNAFFFFSMEGSGCVLVQNTPILLFSKA